MTDSLAARFSVPLGVLLCAFAVTPCTADDDAKNRNLAKRLVAEGHIRSLSAIVEDVRGQLPGEMLEVEFESDDGMYKYEMKILRPDGKVQEVEVDARTGAIVKVEDDD